ncbi:MAG TPA: NAD(P)/FAD-dependent oxidoreductase [Pyrinomonadaceae bacterium]|jgi:flavin-dependent dehydrogenase
MKNECEKIVIAGAGPAGASAAIRLAQNNFQVTLVEREKFPRQKLCGEFISPECLAHFRALGVIDQMLSAGGERITKTVFYEPGGKSVAVPSEWFFQGGAGALSLSRAEMDFRLLERAKAIGVEVLEETQAVGLLIENEIVCGVKARGENGAIKEIPADLTIDATGRARVLGKLFEKEFQRKGAKLPSRKGVWNLKSEISNYQRLKSKDERPNLVGFKTHLKNAEIESGVCEIYFFRGGYGGLSRVENGYANHCFLIQSEIVKKFGGDAEKIVHEIVFQNERARQMMKGARADFDWLAVSVDGFGAKDLNPARRLLAIGDAGAFIDPFTGSGMLMALESGELLARSVAENNFSTEKIAENYKIRHAEKFRKRLFVSSLMRRAAFVPSLAKSVISALSLSEKARAILARATRSAALRS